MDAEFCGQFRSLFVFLNGLLPSVRPFRLLSVVINLVIPRDLFDGFLGLLQDFVYLNEVRGSQTVVPEFLLGDDAGRGAAGAAGATCLMPGR